MSTFCSAGYPAPPSLNLTARQTMLSFAYLAYTGEGITDTNPESSILANINAAIPQIPVLCQGGNTTTPDWKIVWGPQVYFVAGALYPENMMYVAQNISDPSQYIIAIRGTDFASEVDWLLEDFNVATTVCWPLGATSPTPAGAMISESASISMNILLGMGNTATTQNSIIDFLQGQTAAGAINVCVTGHSLGGLLSGTMALYLLENQSDWDQSESGNSTVSFISFAGPTAGNNMFAAYSNSAFQNATRPPASMWDPTMNTNGDVIQSAFDIAPMMYVSTNISTPAIENTAATAGPLFEVYQPNINWKGLDDPSGLAWSKIVEYVLPGLAGLTASQNYAPLGLANSGSPIPGIFNGPAPASDNLADYLACFAAQAAWQHSFSYPNIFGMCQWLLDPTIVVRNTQLSTTGISPTEVKRSNDPISLPVTITGAGFSGVTNIEVYAGPSITVSDVSVVSDTQITATFGVTIDTPRATYNVSVSGISGIGQIKSNAQAFLVYWSL